MRTLLRRIPTGEYYQTLSHWTTDPADAYDFRAVDPAIQFAQLARLAQTEVVVGSEKGRVTAIPVTKFRNGFPVRGVVDHGPAFPSQGGERAPAKTRR